MNYTDKAIEQLILIIEKQKQSLANCGGCDYEQGKLDPMSIIDACEYALNCIREKQERENPIWKTISDFDSKYEINQFGDVRIKNSKNVLAKTLNRYGYHTVWLIQKNKRKNCLIHRLVATAFLTNPNGLPEVNHKDEIKTNNFYGNLEWCTTSYNLQYNGLAYRRNLNNRKPLRCIDINGNETIYESLAKASEITGINESNISMTCLGQRNKAGGYFWEYIDKHEPKRSE